jgi:hypothetical protein
MVQLMADQVASEGLEERKVWSASVGRIDGWVVILSGIEMDLGMQGFD